MCIYIYVCVCVCVCCAYINIYIHIYMYIYLADNFAKNETTKKFLKQKKNLFPHIVFISV